MAVFGFAVEQALRKPAKSKGFNGNRHGALANALRLFISKAGGHHYFVLASDNPRHKLPRAVWHTGERLAGCPTSNF
jgi:hypothetical protein